MKRWVKAWLAAGIGCCVCGAVLLGIGAASGGSKYVKEADLNRLEGSAKRSDNEAVLEKTKLDDFDSVDISMSDMNLQVVSSDDQFCYIAYQASDQKKEPISYQVRDDKLTIQEIVMMVRVIIMLISDFYQDFWVEILLLRMKMW